VGAAEGRAKLILAVGECVGKACEMAGLDPANVRYEAACFGMSGGPADKTSILYEILPAAQLVVTTDAVIALAGGTGGGPGIITIAGTGSIAFGRNQAGRIARVGGWGYVFGDEGGGFDITRQALRAALRMEEGWGPSTSLRRLLLEAAGAEDANDLLHRFYTQAYPRPRVASYSKIVDEAAREGDEIAAGILRNAASQLASLTASVRGQLWNVGESVEVVYIGGVFQSEILLAEYTRLAEAAPGIVCVPPRYGPAAGALLEAYRSAGLKPELQDVPPFKE